MGDGYVISYIDGEPVAMHHIGCGWKSYYKIDIAHRYCPKCHRFLDLFVLDEGQGLAIMMRDALGWPEED